jgi:hypothetical protein
VVRFGFRVAADATRLPDQGSSADCLPHGVMSDFTCGSVAAGLGFRLIQSETKPANIVSSFAEGEVIQLPCSG